MAAPIQCGDERRRAAARAAGRNGIDSIGVSVDQRSLTVTLFGKAPDDLGPESFRITGGRHVTGIRVLTVEVCADADPELADCLTLTVDQPGDYSTYQLCVVEPASYAGPGTRPHPAFDERYACAGFSFKQNCPGQLDCAVAEECPPRSYQEPVIDYLAKDYASLRRVLLERLALIMPAWTERHVPDLGVTLVELLAYAGDQLSYLQDAVATEAYLDTARLRVSVRRHARLVDYRMHDGCAARAFVCLEAGSTMTLPAGDFRFSAGSEVFEPVQAEDVTIHPAHNRISLWTWGDQDCCLPVGATSATLRDSDPAGSDATARVLALQPGDVLVFEELLDPRTGLTADADPTHRQAVRLTSVQQGMDPLYQQPVLEVAWSDQDRLGFALCVSARGGADCADLEVGVARGNAVLVEHGRSRTWCGDPPESTTLPAPPPPERGCPCPPDFGCPDDAAADLPAYPPLHARVRLRLAHQPVTQRAPYPDPADVARGQAAQLRGIPTRARARLGDLLRAAAEGQPRAGDDAAYLVTLFGAGTLAKVRLGDDPAAALRTLLARFDELLATKLDRVAGLARRAWAGYLLQAADEGWEIGQSWGAAEGDALDPGRAVFRGPATAALSPDPRAALPAVTVAVRGDESNPWRPRGDLLASGPTDRDMVGEVDDDDVLTLRFGDGRTGAVPPPGSLLDIRYRVGNGAGGNVGAGAINQIRFCTTRGADIKSVRNPVAAGGGVDAEPVPEVRLRAPIEAHDQLRRAITTDDYAALAGRLPGVQRAAADLRWSGSWYEVRVAVDALGGEPAGAWLLDQERAALHRYRRIGHDLVVAPATLVPLRLELCVQVEPDYITGHVRQAVLEVLGSGVLPDGRLGLFHLDNLTFGTPVRISRIVATVAAVPGVRAAAVTALQRLFGQPDDALDTGVLVLGPDEVAQLDNDPTRPENGVLGLVMGGGR
jgi:predicted phage baseplate assembly protein